MKQRLCHPPTTLSALLSRALYLSLSLPRSIALCRPPPPASAPPLALSLMHPLSVSLAKCAVVLFARLKVRASTKARTRSRACIYLARRRDVARPGLVPSTTYECPGKAVLRCGMVLFTMLRYAQEPFEGSC